MSVGEFLCEKVLNMYAWLSDDGLPHVLNPLMVTPVLATAWRKSCCGSRT